MSKHTIDRQALAMRIQQLEGLTNDEKAALLELLNTRKKYGLVWEDKPEQVEEELRSKIPVFTEVKDRAIINDIPTEHYPNHLLIEGDNLQALTTLAYTHEGKIDVIYIDPPYNTGNKDFVYNDHFVDSEDSYRHSKWLSFMSRRLEIAKRLLSDKGVIFISIDDNEQANLKLLCDEVFGEDNLIANFIWQSTPGSNTGNDIKTVTEYIILYSKNKELFVANTREISDKTKYNLSDNHKGRRGNYILNKLDRRMTGSHYSEALNYSIETPDGSVLYPGSSVEKQEHWNWRWSKQKVVWGIENDFIVFKKQKDVWSIYFKQYEKVDNTDTLIQRTLPYSNLLEDESFNSARGSADLMNVLNVKKFDYPKPNTLIKRVLEIASIPTSTILDFFAGSGTTLHATMQLNAEDGGQRQCILVTNNENNICEEVTYERNKRVISGYTTPKGEQVEGLHHNNLRYYKTELVERENSQQNRKALMKASADLLCIKEDIYTEKDELNGTKFNKQYIRFYQDGDRSMLLVFDPRAIDSVVERLGGMAFAHPVKVYVYSADEYPYTDDFAPVADKVQLVALPTALRKALQNVLPADGPQRPVEGMEPAADATAGGDLFNQPTGEE